MTISQYWILYYGSLSLIQDYLIAIWKIIYREIRIYFYLYYDTKLQYFKSRMEMGVLIVLDGKFQLHFCRTFTRPYVAKLEMLID